VRFTELICRLASQRFKEGARLGVRLSPVELSPDEASELAAMAGDVIGPGVHVAVACPGASELDAPRRCVSVGERAAERATGWRNTIVPASGERILYVSVERQGKAGGFVDTLEEIGERDLREAFTAWCATSQTELPAALASAMTASAGLMDRIACRALCDFSEEVRQAPSEEQRWDVAEQQLPRLSLTRDSGLRGDPAARLQANARLVREAATSDARSRTRYGPAAREKLEDVARALAAPGVEASEALTQVDIGSLTVDELTSAPTKQRAPKAGAGGRAPPAKKPKVAKKGREAVKGPARATERAEAERQDRVSQALEARGGAGGPEPRGERPPTVAAETMEPKAAEPVGVHTPLATVQPANVATSWASVEAQLYAAEPADAETVAAQAAVWTDAMQRREFGTASTSLPEGLMALLEASLRQPMAALRWVLPRGPLAAALDRPPKHTPDPAVDRLAPTDGGDLWAAALAQALQAREALVAPLLAASKPGALVARLVHAPLLALGEPTLRVAVKAWVEAAAAVLHVAAEQGQQPLARRALAAETLALEEAEGGEVLMLLSPLHPLWLGHALDRYEVMANSGELKPVERRLLVRSLAQAPAAPSAWPYGAARELPLAPPIEGLIAFASRGEVAAEAALEDIGRGLLTRLMELHPHALAGARVVVEGAAPKGLLKGIMAAASALANTEPPLKNLQLFAAGSAAAAAAAASTELGERRAVVDLLPLPVQDEARGALRPHLVIVVADTPDPDPEERPLAQPYTLHASLRRDRTVGADGATISTLWVRGMRGLDQVERAVAAALDRPSVGAFALTQRPTRLAEVAPRAPLDTVTWQAAVSGRLDRRTRPQATLLLHERVGDAQVAVLTSELRPTTDHLAELYRRLGVQDVRHSTLLRLTQRLALTSPLGLLSLHQSSEGLLAAHLLSAALREVLGEGVVFARLEGGLHQTITGAKAAGDDPLGVMAVAAVRRGKGVRLVLGYAALRDPLPVEVEGALLRGELADRLLQGVQALELAGRPDTIGGAIARDLLAELLWDVVADGAAEGADVARLLTGEQPLEVEVTAVVLLPKEHPLIGRAQGVRLRGAGEVVIRPVDEQLLQRVLLGG
jgi:hypothetical protein